MAISTGQITIIDYNDALSLTGFISANRPKTQLYNPDTGVYNPDYTTSNMVLTASLFKIGAETDIIASAKTVKWRDSAGTAITGTTTNYTVSGKNLTIKKNILTNTIPTKDFIVEIVYTDTATGLDLVFKTGISISQVVNGGGIVNAVAWAPEGNIFKNGEIASLTAECNLMRGTGVTDTTNVTYTWERYMGGTTGWQAVTGTTNTLIITPSMVPSLMTFRCSIKDTDPSSSTYGDTFKDSITFIDQSDPIQVVVTSSSGNILKNGAGSTILTAVLYRDGNEIDGGGTLYNYTWSKRDKEGASANFANEDATKTGKTIAVGDADVDVKATFTVILEAK